MAKIKALDFTGRGTARIDNLSARVTRSGEDTTALRACVKVYAPYNWREHVETNVYFATDDPGNEDIVRWEPASNHEDVPSMKELVVIRRAHESLVRREQPLKRHRFAESFEEE